MRLRPVVGHHHAKEAKEAKGGAKEAKGGAKEAREAREANQAKEEGRQPQSHLTWTLWQNKSLPY